jgi:hypothetical protein
MGEARYGERPGNAGGVQGAADTSNKFKRNGREEHVSGASGAHEWIFCIGKKSTATVSSVFEVFYRPSVSLKNPVIISQTGSWKK